MKTDNIAKLRAGRVWLTAADCDLAAFAKQIDRRTEAAEFPRAAGIVKNVPIYDGDAVRHAANDAKDRREMMAEWAELLLSGPGILVIKRAFADITAVDAATSIFFDMIAEQNASGAAAGDHFAKPGANDRVWNVQQKLALKAPEVFARYFSNPVIAMASEAWLGPGYQINTQLNVVNPGGAAQAAHRDYHMGFQTAAEIGRFPVHAHLFNPMLILQGAVAHVAMPVESGPTLYLPYSQTFAPGYYAWTKPEFEAYFAENHVQLPLDKGDAVFFSPALFHAAGHNRTKDVKRMALLLQTSSVYGRAMEAIDRAAMSVALFPVLKRLRSEGVLDDAGIANAIAASAEGYAFPTNLDRDPPLGGLAPPSQAQIMHKALTENWKLTTLAEALGSHSWRHIP